MNNSAGGARGERASEISEELLNKVAAGGVPRPDAATPPDPFIKIPRRTKNGAGGDAVTPPDPF